MGNVTEIVEESKVLLEIIEPGGGQIEIVDNSSTQLEIIESGSSLNPTTLDVTPQINTIIVDSVTENTNIDILVSDPITIETSTTNNVIEIVEDQVVYQTGSLYEISYNSFSSSVTFSSTTSSTITHINNVAGDTIVEASGDTPGILIESGGLFQIVTQSITQSGNDFTDEQREELLALIYDNGTVSLSENAPSNPEKTIPINIKFTYNVNLNDDQLSTAKFDNVDITNLFDSSTGNFDPTFQTYNNVDGLGDNPFKKTFVVTFAKNSRQASSQASVTFRTPQYVGVSLIEDFNNKSYDFINDELNKKLQSGPNMQQTVIGTDFGGTSGDHYFYFINTKSNPVFKDSNNFVHTDFITTTILVEYHDGTTYELFQHRTSEVKPFIETITYESL